MKFKLAFAIHNHQPVGNFSAVFEEAYQKCYLPFLQELEKHPNIKISFHQSGILWDWQKQHHSEFFSFVGKLVDQGQIELLSGGFYEPILPAIPDRDKIGQLNMLSNYLKKHFEFRARGMWLAERVWEPHLPKVINECDLNFLPIDDTHFHYAGLKDDQLYGPYITEEAGKAVLLLPISKKLRYSIPFADPEEIVESLRNLAAKHPGGMAVYADDGEKFGTWPGTHQHCYDDRWLERFFNILDENSDWLEVVSLGQAVEDNRPLGRVYLPTASYSEMLHWSLPVNSYEDYEKFEDILKEYKLHSEYERFVRGGHWRGFLSKYPESNLMHKKMLAVSDLLDKVSCLESMDNDQLEKAKSFVYAGQCNCAYWHGVFGGLYLPHLRWAIYNKLIRAEKILRKLVGREVFAEFEDYNRDGYKEIQANNQELSIIVAPHHGGQIIDLSCFSNNINLVDCLARRKEGYHNKLTGHLPESENGETKSIHDSVNAKESGLDKLLVADNYLRRPLADHFLLEDITIESFLKRDYKELGDFVDGDYESSFIENEDDFQITLSRRGHVFHGDYHCPLKVEKTIIFPKKGNTIDIKYRLLQNSLEIMPVNFAVEFDFNLLTPEAEDRYALIDGIRPGENSHLGAIGIASPASSVAFIDEYQNIGIQIDCDQSGKIWRMPIYTVSLSEGGFEKVFQGNATLFLFHRALVYGKEFSFNLRLYAGKMSDMASRNSESQIIASKI